MSHLLKNYNRASADFVSGKGVYLYDAKGNEYLDFLCGIAVTPFGHQHEGITAAVSAQLQKLWHTSNLFSSQVQEHAAEMLLNKAGLQHAFFCNSGTEANEAAIKFARKSKAPRHKILAAWGGFHGRTYGSLSATGKESYWKDFGPLLPGIEFFNYGDISSVEKLMDSQTAAVIIEPIQGENGIVPAPDGFLKQLRELCTKHDVLLILDEIQSGMGRTGKLFAHEHEQIQPDIITLAKGLANGLPIGAVLLSEKVSGYIKPGDHGSTFGGNPVSLSAATAVLGLIADSVMANNVKMGSMLLEELRFVHHPAIKEIRGKGLMCGVEFEENVPAGDVVKMLMEQRVVTCTAGKNTVRILPPYIIGTKEIEQFMTAWKTVIGSIKEKE